MAVFMKVHTDPWKVICSSKQFLLGTEHFMPRKAEHQQEAYLQRERQTNNSRKNELGKIKMCDLRIRGSRVVLQPSEGI